MGNITQEQIGKLRQAAAALVEDCAEPCWGLAQDLSIFVEQLVLSSADLRQAESGCPACGEIKGRHHAWCIHAHEQSAPERLPALPVHYFGCCPRCHKEGQIRHIGCDEWCICDKHMIAWWIGSNLFSGWQEMTQEQHEANRALIEQCERIEQPNCTCQQPVVEQVYYEAPENFCSYPRQCSNCERAGSNCGRLMEEHPFSGPEGSADERRLEIQGYGQWLNEQGLLTEAKLHSDLDALEAELSDDNDQDFSDIMSSMDWP